jgi:hypothetical protein
MIYRSVELLVIFGASALVLLACTFVSRSILARGWTGTLPAYLVPGLIAFIAGVTLARNDGAYEHLHRADLHFPTATVDEFLGAELAVLYLGLAFGGAGAIFVTALDYYLAHSKRS